MGIKIPRLYFRNQVNLYVLFLVGRVGSTYLTHMLDTHPAIQALGEKSLDFQNRDAVEQVKMTDNWLTPPLIGTTKVLGINAKLVHLADPGKFAQLLHEKNCRIIHLQRRNRVKAVVSHLNGKRLSEATGMWGLFRESDRLPPFSVDPDEFDSVLRKREARDLELADYVDNLQLPTLNLFYEDLQTSKETFLNEVFAFLEVIPKSVHGMTLKITSDDLREVLINFNELRDMYIGTIYEPMFDEIVV